MHRLDAMSAPDKLGGQAIEQFGVRGRLSAGAEVVRRRHKPPTEVPRPDPVDDDPGEQRMPGDPPGEFATAALRVRRHRIPAKRSQPAAGHLVTEFFGIPAIVDAGRLRGLPIDDGVRDRNCRRRHDGLFRAGLLLGSLRRLARVRGRHWRHVLRQGDLPVPVVGMPLPPRLHRGVDLGLRDERHEIPRLALRLAAREGEPRTGEDPVEGVVVVGVDGIVFVIVAAGAGHRQAEEALAEIVDRILVHEVNIGVDVVAEPACDRQVSRGHDAFGMLRCRLLPGQQVAGDLQRGEPIERHVVLKRLEHPVAIPPGLWQRAVGILAGRVGVADHVEPVPPPAHPVLRRL